MYFRKLGWDIRAVTVMHALVHTQVVHGQCQHQLLEVRQLAESLAQHSSPLEWIYPRVTACFPPSHLAESIATHHFTPGRIHSNKHITSHLAESIATHQFTITIGQNNKIMTTAKQQQLWEVMVSTCRTMPTTAGFTLSTSTTPGFTSTTAGFMPSIQLRML